MTDTGFLCKSEWKRLILVYLARERQKKLTKFCPVTKCQKDWHQISLQKSVKKDWHWFSLQKRRKCWHWSCWQRKRLTRVLLPKKSKKRLTMVFFLTVYQKKLTLVFLAHESKRLTLVLLAKQSKYDWHWLSSQERIRKDGQWVSL